MTTAPTSTSTEPRASDFLALNRGGGLFTETVNQRIASHLCLLAYRWRLAPTALTLTNLCLGLAASATVIGLAEGMAAGDVPALVVGLVALVVWQLAYSLDCADGQLARLTKRTSPAGGRVDVLSDVALQISVVAAVCAVADAYSPKTPVWLLAAFAGTWMVNLVTSVLQQGTGAASLVSSGALIIRCVKLIRDYGAVITVVGLTLAVIPEWTVWLAAAFTLVNGGFLLASIAAAARASLRVS